VKILLTGAKGFIGRNIVQFLGDKHEIVEATRESKINISKLNSLLAISDVDVVIHTAAKTFVPDSFIDPYNFYKFNINSSLNIAEYCRIKKVKRLIYLNSYPYGIPEYCPIDEKHRISLHSPYNKSKYISEEVIINYLEGITKVVSLRMFNLYGKYQKSNFLVPHIVEQALEKDSVIVRDLEPKRDYLYIKDLVLLIDSIIDSNPIYGVYNVGSGTSYSVAKVISMVSDILEKPIKVEVVGDRRENEVMNCFADIEKITRDFDWSREYSFYDGLVDYINEKKIKTESR
jgi:UDP-glucose 4-epimerase